MVRPGAIPFVLLALLAAACAVQAVPAGGRDRADTLRNRIDAQRGRERTLTGALARLGRLERATAREVAVLERRVAAVQGELAQAQALLADTVQRRNHEHARALRLRARLAESRTKLARLLRDRYAGGKPDLVTVVLHADGFARLLETVDFIKRVQRQDQRILQAVREARAEALAQRRVLTRLATERQRAAEAVLRRRDALASIAAGLRARRALTRLLAQRSRALHQAGPGGPWAIPWPIVQCESGGQNLPPNSAGASGYYQFLVETWRGLSGSTPQAFQASKAEQDRLAAQLWDGGRGAHNWVCAVLLGAV
jgi:hypothetical protein